jgi:hypothetical protein
MSIRTRKRSAEREREEKFAAVIVNIPRAT